MKLHLPPARPDSQTKARWRSELRAARRELVARQGPAGRAEQAAALASVCVPWLRRYVVSRGHADLAGCSVSAYASLPTEPPVEELTAVLHGLGVSVWLPVALPEGLLRWRLLEDPTAQTGPVDAGAHPLRPSAAALASSRDSSVLQELDLALVPALAVGRDGRRLGQGGGYYDRALPLLRRHDIPAVAVLHDHEWLDQVPSEPHDATVDGVLTSSGVHRIPTLTPPGSAPTGPAPPRRPPDG